MHGGVSELGCDQRAREQGALLQHPLGLVLRLVRVPLFDAAGLQVPQGSLSRGLVPRWPKRGRQVRCGKGGKGGEGGLAGAGSVGVEFGVGGGCPRHIQLVDRGEVAFYAGCVRLSWPE